MKFTEEQIKFLDKVYKDRHRWICWERDGVVIIRGTLHANGMNLTEIPIRFSEISGDVYLKNNKLTSLESLTGKIGRGRKLYVGGNNLTDYFKNLKRKDFKYWDKLNWWEILNEYPFMINRAKRFVKRPQFKGLIDRYPQTKLYLKD